MTKKKPTKPKLPSEPGNLNVDGASVIEVNGEKEFFELLESEERKDAFLDLIRKLNKKKR